MSSQPEPPVSSQDFRRACSRFATGVSIASVLDDEGTPHGLTVNSFSSVSLEPPLILICLGHQVTCIEVFRSAKRFAINILRAEQQEIAERFSRKGEDRFDGVPWVAGCTGAPVLPGVLAVIECSVFRKIPCGDHDIFVGEVIHAEVEDGDPLLYYASRYRTLGVD